MDWDYLSSIITESVARHGELETDGGRNLSSADFFDVFSVVGVHEQNSAYTLSLALCDVHDRLSSLECSGVDSEVGKLTVRIRHNLESDGRKRLVVACFSGQNLACFRVDTLNSRNVERRGHVCHYGIEQFLYALVFI